MARAGEADHHRLDRRRRADERRIQGIEGRLAADRDLPPPARDPRRRGRARHDAVAEERRPLPGRVCGRAEGDSGLTYRDFHVNIVHESAHYLGNTNLSLRRDVTPDAMLHAVKEVAKLRGAPMGPVGYLERAYLETGRAVPEDRRHADALPRHALSASCFVGLVGQRLPVHDLRPQARQPARRRLRPAPHLELRLAVRTRRRRSGSTTARSAGRRARTYQSIMGNFLGPGRLTNGRPPPGTRSPPDPSPAVPAAGKS